MHYSEGALWRPLFEQDMEILQVATGCSWNACRFCDMYHKGFHPSPMKEIEEDIDELSHLWRVPPRIFLGGGNAFHLDTTFLLDVLALIHRKLPRVQSVGCFARIDDIAQKSDEEISALLAQGMDLISIGAESGYDPALASMHKGFTSKDIIEQCSRLDAAGMRYAFFYMAGLAGHGHGIENAQASAKVFGAVNPSILMIHTLNIFDGTPLARSRGEGSFVPETEIEIMQELRELYATYPKHVRMLALHYANTVTFDGYVPEQRDQILELMDSQIAKADESRLEAFRQSIKSI
ncbi:MAG: radical SAM protein [Atopobiaceae bacterium]